MVDRGAVSVVVAATFGPAAPRSVDPDDLVLSPASRTTSPNEQMLRPR